MRVIAGEAKGRSLKWPKEPRIRPTSELVRGAIFSALESLEVDWSHVLDLYAGTGALGIEALSRGAVEVDFVEQNPKCCAVIKQNLGNTGFAKQGRVYCMEAQKALRTLKGQYGIVLLDPPYLNESEQDMLGKIAHSNLVSTQTTIVMEHSEKKELEPAYGNFQVVKYLHHGDTRISIFQWQGGIN